MEEAYRVGVTLALKGNVSTIIDKLVEQFGVLDKAIKATQDATKGLSASMAALGREGRSAAQEWQKAAAAMERAAKAARSSAGASMRPPGGYDGGGPTSGPRRSSTAQAAIQSYYYGWNAQAGQMRLNNEASTQFRLVGPSYGGPGRALVPVPGTERTSDYGRSPDRGALDRYAGPRYGATVPYGSRGSVGDAEFDEPFDADGKIPLYPKGRRGRAQKESDPMYGIFAAGIGAELIKSIFAASFAVGDEKSRMLNQQMTPEQVEAAYKQAVDLQRRIPGSTILGNLSVTGHAMAVTQDANEAIAITPQMVAFDRLMSLTNHTKEGQDLMAALRVAEFRGAILHKDPKTGKEVVDTEAIKNVTDLMAAASQITGGDIGPSQIQQMLRSAGTVGGLMGNKAALTDSLALQIALGSAKAGAAMQGFAQQFDFGRMSEVSANMLIKNGIIRGGGDAKHNKFIKKSGFGQFQLLPGAFADGMQESAFNTPADFVMEYLYPKIQKDVAKVYGDKYTKADPLQKLQYESAYGATIASRLPGGTFITEIIRNAALIQRDREAAKKQLESGGVDKSLATQQATNPKAQQEAMAAAYDAFKVALGDAALKPAIEVLGAMTKVLNQFSDWARNNPDGAKIALEGLAGGIAMFGAEAAAGMAMKTLTGKGGFVALATGIEALGHSLGSFPGWFADVITGAIGGYKVGGAPGAVLGGVGAGVASGAEAARKLVEGNPAFKGYHMVPMGPGGTMMLMPDSPTKPNAPKPQPQSANQTLGTRENPSYSYTVNGRDIVHGVTAGQGSMMNRPPDGPSGSNLGLSPAAAWNSGGGWVP